MFKYYIEEVRNRFFIILLTWIITFGTCYYYKQILSYCLIKSGLFFQNFKLLSFIYTDLIEIISYYINLSIFITNNIVMIICFYHILDFFYLALRSYEYMIIKYLYFLYLIILFLTILIINHIIIPFTWNFFLSFQQFDGYNLSFESKFIEYLKLYKNIYYTILINNIIFGVLYLFMFLNLTTINLFKKFRKLFYLFFAFNATILTPPDVTSQLFFSFCQICWFEFLMFFGIFKKHFN